MFFESDTMGFHNSAEFPDGTPSYNPGGGNGGNNLNWQSIINSGFNIASQAISGWANNPNTQQWGVGGTPWGGQYSAQGVQIAQAQAAAYANNPRNDPRNDPRNNPRDPRGGGIGENAFEGITNFIRDYPVPIAAAALGVFLLMREPPRGRR